VTRLRAYVDGRVVTVVVYRRRLRIINLQSPFLRCAAATVTTSRIEHR
jgi:hypothetical protein